MTRAALLLAMRMVYSGPDSLYMAPDTSIAWPLVRFRVLAVPPPPSWLSLNWGWLALLALALVVTVALLRAGRTETVEWPEDECSE